MDEKHEENVAASQQQSSDTVDENAISDEPQAPSEEAASQESVVKESPSADAPAPSQTKSDETSVDEISNNSGEQEARIEGGGEPSAPPVDDKPVPVVEPGFGEFVGDTGSGEVQVSDEEFPPEAVAGQPEPGEMDIEIDPEPTAEEESIDCQQEIVDLLESSRKRLVQVLFAQERASSQDSDGAIGQYVSAVSLGVDNGVIQLDDEVQTVRNRAQSANGISLERERGHLKQANGRVRERNGNYDLLFAELKVLHQEIDEELAARDPASETFSSAPEELQAQLTNYRKGGEIIHRMLSRVLDRKQDLPDESPGNLEEEWPGSKGPESLDGLTDFIQELASGFHKLRDANFHVIEDAQKASEKSRSQVFQTVKSVLSAIDGIDAGLANEEHLRKSLLELCQSDSPAAALVEKWLGAYQRLNAAADAFLMRTGIEAHTVEPGTPFDPVHMEPQGTVEDPDLKDEDVAAVIRRGFSLEGELIRPILVDVVRNPPKPN
ncbi:MAG: nucleotide exchange factor GrpE [Planctomycetaceae bacterium]|nr:nucleotide exchange factor GrpE [Planctomycetaceae bacterium]